MTFAVPPPKPRSVDGTTITIKLPTRPDEFEAFVDALDKVRSVLGSKELLSFCKAQDRGIGSKQNESELRRITKDLAVFQNNLLNKEGL